jgi:hypothetical protein
MVGGTLHHQTTFSASVVRLVPLSRAPPLHHLLPALRMRGAPIRNHLKKYKYRAYQKIKLSIFSTNNKVLYYVQVLVRSQRHGSGVLLAHLLPKDGAVVSDDGMDARLVVHVHDELLTARGSHHIRPGLVSSLASEEILHTNTMYPYIISRICNKCDLLNNIVRGRLTHNSCFTRSALLLNSLPSRSTASGATA